MSAKLVDVQEEAVHNLQLQLPLLGHAQASVVVKVEDHKGQQAAKLASWGVQVESQASFVAEVHLLQAQEMALAHRCWHC